MYGSRKAIVALALVAAGCTPVPPPPIQPVAMKFAPCVNLNSVTFGCDLNSHAFPPGMITWADGGAWTREPVGYITIHFILEMDHGGTTGFVKIWDAQRGGATKLDPFGNHYFEGTTEYVGCGHGRYQWHMEVSYAGFGNTTYTTTGPIWTI